MRGAYLWPPALRLSAMVRLAASRAVFSATSGSYPIAWHPSTAAVLDHRPAPPTGFRSDPPQSKRSVAASSPLTIRPYRREVQLVAGTPPGPDVLQLVIAQGGPTSADLVSTGLRALFFCLTSARHRIRHGIRHTAARAGRCHCPGVVPDPTLEAGDGPTSLDLAARGESLELDRSPESISVPILGVWRWVRNGSATVNGPCGSRRRISRRAPGTPSMRG